MPTRLLTPADAHAYAAIRRESLIDSPWAFGRSPTDDPGSDPEIVAARLHDPENLTVGSFDDASPRALLAIASIFRSPIHKARHRATIVAVYVTPSARGRGLGRAVVQGCIDAARSWLGVEVVGLAVSENAPAALKLYTSLGFIVWGREPDALRTGGCSYDEFYLQLRIG